MLLTEWVLLSQKYFWFDNIDFHDFHQNFSDQSSNNILFNWHDQPPTSLAGVTFHIVQCCNKSVRLNVCILQCSVASLCLTLFCFSSSSSKMLRTIVIRLYCIVKWLNEVVESALGLVWHPQGMYKTLRWYLVCGKLESNHCRFRFLRVSTQGNCKRMWIVESLQPENLIGMFGLYAICAFSQTTELTQSIVCRH